MSCAAPMKGGRRTRRRGGGDEEPPKQDIKEDKKGGRRSRKAMKGGNFYSFGFDPQTGTGGAGFTAVENNAVDPKTGAAIPDYAMPTKGGKRRGSRKSKKASRKSKRRSRKMKGGANWASVGAVGAAYKGEGSAGLANYSAYAQKAPVGGPTQGADGVYKA